jgi:ATP-dependent RNA helicase DDX35
LGEEVGYCVRFDDCTHPQRTRVKFVTDGVLVRETLYDPLLSRYSVVMVDEAHERTLHVDVLLGLLKKIMRRRPDLRVVVSSATLDAQAFKTFFESGQPDKGEAQRMCAVVAVPGRQHAVQCFFTKEPVRDYLASAVDTVFHIHRTHPAGDILVFLTGREEIEEAARVIASHAAADLSPVPLYAALPPDQQLRAFRPAPRGARKVVLATNVAETSLTLPGIVYVVDCGLVKTPFFDPRTGVQTLQRWPVSRAAAAQRAGRAGRVRPGLCFRLYTEATFAELDERPVPELQRSNLAAVLLELKALGVEDVVHFPFLSPPHPRLLARALETLFALGAIDDTCALTRPMGERMAELPVEPEMARVLLRAVELGCAEEALSLAAVLTVPDVFAPPRQFRHKAEEAWRKWLVKEGDHLTLLNVLNAFLEAGRDPDWCHDYYLNFRALRRAADARKQLRKALARFGLPLASSRANKAAGEPDRSAELVRKALVAGFFAHAAQMQPDGSYVTVRGAVRFELHPASVLFRRGVRWVLFHDLQFGDRAVARVATAIEPLWLAEAAPHFFEYRGAAPHAEAPAARGGAAPDEVEIVGPDGRRVKHRRIF